MTFIMLPSRHGQGDLFPPSLILTACIQTLPPELLGRIFDFARLNEPGSLDNRPRWIIRTTHVCRRWRAAALASPELWNHINLHHHREIHVQHGDPTTSPPAYRRYQRTWSSKSKPVKPVQDFNVGLPALHLERAKLSPLTINCVAQNPRDGSLFAAQLEDQMSRIKSLLIGIPFLSLSKAAFLAKSAPLLVRLSIFCFNGDSMSALLRGINHRGRGLFGDLLAGDAPRLKELTLSDCEINLTGIRPFTTLTYLRIAHVPLYARPSIRDFCDLLRSLSSLRVLLLEECFPTSGTTRLSDPLRIAGMEVEAEPLRIRLGDTLRDDGYISLPNLREILVTETQYPEDEWACLRVAQIVRRLDVQSNVKYTCKILSPYRPDEIQNDELESGIRSLIPPRLLTPPPYDSARDFQGGEGLGPGRHKIRLSQTSEIWENDSVHLCMHWRPPPTASPEDGTNASSFSPPVSVIIIDRIAFPPDPSSSPSTDELDPHPGHSDHGHAPWETDPDGTMVHRSRLVWALCSLWRVERIRKLTIADIVLPKAFFSKLGHQSVALRTLSVKGDAMIPFLDNIHSLHREDDGIGLSALTRIELSGGTFAPGDHIGTLHRFLARRALSLNPITTLRLGPCEGVEDDDIAWLQGSVENLILDWERFAH